MRLNRLAITLLVASLYSALPAWAAAPLPSDQTAASLDGTFTLTDQDGHTVTDAQFRGKWLLVYFGYTHCPDACPVALTSIAAAFDDFDPARRDKVRALFITVDPERDTPQVMKDYVGAFQNPNIVGLTGTAQQVNAAEAAYQVRATRGRTKDGNYSMGHPSALFIMNPEGRFVSRVQPEKVAEHLAQLVP